MAFLSCLGMISAGATEPTFGIVVGKAVSCSGPALTPVANLSVYRGDELVTKRSLPQGSQFRFRLPPGTYVISNQGHPGRFVGSAPFRVRAGRTSRVVVKNFCK
jgi:hypothetical protein